MNRQEIENTLADLFMKRFSIDFLKCPEMQSMKLLSKSGIPAREMLHVYFDIKHLFNISIPEKHITEGRFDTFTHIVDIVWEQTARHENDDKQ